MALHENYILYLLFLYRKAHFRIAFQIRRNEGERGQTHNLAGRDIF